MGDDACNEIRVIRHVSSPADTFEEKTIHVRTNSSGHGGGDAGIMEDFTASLSENHRQTRSSISLSVESHLMAFAMEKSRLTGTVVDLDEYRRSLV